MNPMRPFARAALVAVGVLAGCAPAAGGGTPSAEGGTAADAATKTGTGGAVSDGATATTGTDGAPADSAAGSGDATTQADAETSVDGATESGGLDASVAGDGGVGLGGPSRCLTAGVAFCESFENGLDTTVWRTTKSGDGTAVVDDLHAARGTKALHVQTTSGNGFAYITENKSFPATNNVLYGRMFLWLQNGLVTDGHFSLAEGDGTGTPAAIRFGGQFKAFGVGSDHGASGDWTDHDTKAVPSQTWMCLEFEMKGDTSEFHVWWDDVERTALHVGTTQHAGFTMPAFNSLWFGWWMYNAVEPKDLWIDEIAVDFKPIGCAK